MTRHPGSPEEISSKDSTTLTSLQCEIGLWPGFSVLIATTTVNSTCDWTSKENGKFKETTVGPVDEKHERTTAGPGNENRKETTVGSVNGKHERTTAGLGNENNKDIIDGPGKSNILCYHSSLTLNCVIHYKFSMWNSTPQTQEEPRN